MELLLGLAAGALGIAALLQSKSPLPSAEDYAKALAKLKDTPGDPDANLVVGKYMAFVQGNYKEGLPFFTRANDATLRTLAEHEGAPLYTDTAAKKVGMGDEWVAAAKNFKPLYRTFYDRASQWYAQAYPDLEGIWRDKTHERFMKLLQVPTPGGAVKKGFPAGWISTQPNGRVFYDGTVAHNGGRSMRIEMTRDNPNAPFWFQSPSFPVPKGEVIATAYVATDQTNSPNDKFMLNFYNQAGGLVSYLEAKFLPDSPWWQRVEIKADVPKTAAKFAVAGYFYSSVGTVWMDDFSLKSADAKEQVENGSFEK